MSRKRVWSERRLRWANFEARRAAVTNAVLRQGFGLVCLGCAGALWWQAATGDEKLGSAHPAWVLLLGAAMGAFGAYSVWGWRSDLGEARAAIKGHYVRRAMRGDVLSLRDIPSATGHVPACALNDDLGRIATGDVWISDTRAYCVLDGEDDVFVVRRLAVRPGPEADAITLQLLSFAEWEAWSRRRHRVRVRFDAVASDAVGILDALGFEASREPRGMWDKVVAGPDQVMRANQRARKHFRS